MPPSYFDEESVRRIVRSVLKSEREFVNGPINPRPINRRVVSGAETFRLIRGRSVGNQSGTVVFIDDIEVLAGGLDPSSGSALVQVPVSNFEFITGNRRTFIDNQWLDAIYNLGVSFVASGTGTASVDWETLEGGTAATGTEKYRLIQGLSNGTFLASDSAVQVTGVEVLAGGIDPTGGNPFAAINLDQSQKEEFHTGDPIVGISDGAGTADWRTLAVERRRLIRGDYVSSVDSSTSGLILINNIDVLAGGVDPRSNPSNAAEQVLVRIMDNPPFTGTLGDKVYAAYNYGVGYSSVGTACHWEKLPSDPRFNVVIGETTAQVLASDATFQIGSLQLVHGELPSGLLTVTQAFPVGYAAGQLVMAFQGPAGDWCNTPDSGKVRVSSADMLPEYLHDSIVDQTTFSAASHKVVYAEPTSVGGGNYRVKLFTNITGTSTGTYTTFLAFDPNNSNPIDIEVTADGYLSITLNLQSYSGAAQISPIDKTGTGRIWKTGTFETFTDAYCQDDNLIVETVTGTHLVQP